MNGITADEVTNKRKCSTCKYFQSRCGFCRKNPPQVVVNADGFYVAVFPKIAFPMLDFCFEYESAEEAKKKSLLS